MARRDHNELATIASHGPSDIGEANDNPIRPIRNENDYGGPGFPCQPNPGISIQPLYFPPARDIGITLSSLSGTATTSGRNDSVSYLYVGQLIRHIVGRIIITLVSVRRVSITARSRLLMNLAKEFVGSLSRCRHDRSSQRNVFARDRTSTIPSEAPRRRLTLGGYGLNRRGRSS